MNAGLHEKNADGVSGGSGAQQVDSFAGGGGGAEGCAHGIPSGVLPLRADRGGLPAAAGVSGLARGRSALLVASSARGLAAERAQLGGAGASRLRRQARSRCSGFVGLSDFASSSRLGHLFHFPSLVGARVCLMNSFLIHIMHAVIQGSCQFVPVYEKFMRWSSGRNKAKEYEYSGPGLVQQAPGRLHVETWAGRGVSPSLPISQVVEIMPRCADVVTRLHPPLFSSVSPGPGREVRNELGWSLMEKTARSGVWLFRGALSVSSAFYLHLLHLLIGFRRDRSLQLGRGHPTVFVFLFILVWARHGCRATIWRAVLATA